EPWRRASGQSTWTRLGELTPSVVEEPLRDALRRWVYALLQARLARESDVALEREMQDARAPFDGEPPARLSWRGAGRGVVFARAGAEAEKYLQSACIVAPAIAAEARERAARRMEIARRLGFEHADDPLAPAFVGSGDGARDLSAAASRAALH